MGPKSNFNKQKKKKLVQGNGYLILKLINLSTVRLLSDNTCSKREGVVQ